jgi:Protein of unknown function (DUF2829)
MDIGQAVRRLQSGDRVCREGWNGKNMYLVLVPGSTFTVEEDRPIGQAAPELVGKKVDYHAHVDMYTAQGYFVPWLCSQADLLANDWETYDG